MGARWPLVLAHLQLVVVDELHRRISAIHRRVGREHWPRIFIVLASPWMASRLRWFGDVAARYNTVFGFSLRLFGDGKVWDTFCLCLGLLWCVLYLLGADSCFPISKAARLQIRCGGIHRERCLTIFVFPRWQGSYLLRSVHNQQLFDISVPSEGSQRTSDILARL